MISTQFEFASPKSLDELFLLLSKDKSKAVLSGGYSLIALLKAEKFSPDLLISIDNISAFKGINLDSNGNILIGSTTVLADIADHQAIKDQYPALINAITLIGDRQYCNQTTIGDEYSYASFSMGLLSVLMAYGAKFHYVDKHSKKCLLEPLAPQQELILAAIELPGIKGYSSYHEVKDPASYLPVCGVASYHETEKDIVQLARFVLCGNGLPVLRLSAVEKVVTGDPISKPLDASLFHSLLKDIQHNSSASNEYLAHLAHHLINKSQTPLI